MPSVCITVESRKLIDRLMDDGGNEGLFSVLISDMVWEVML